MHWIHQQTAIVGVTNVCCDHEWDLWVKKFPVHFNYQNLLNGCWDIGYTCKSCKMEVYKSTEPSVQFKPLQNHEWRDYNSTSIGLLWSVKIYRPFADIRFLLEQSFHFDDNYTHTHIQWHKCTMHTTHMHTHNQIHTSTIINLTEVQAPAWLQYNLLRMLHLILIL